MNYILERKLESNFIYVMDLSIQQTCDSQINLGVGTKELIGKINTLTSEYFITYSFKNGAVSCAGQKCPLVLGGNFKTGDKIRMVVDRRNKEISWQKEDIEHDYWYQFYSIEEPEHLNNEDLYPIITMYK